MNKPRAAPLLRALASLHTFAPRPAAGAFHAFALLCAHVWALANVRKTGYASISVFAAACSLFIHIYLLILTVLAGLHSDQYSPLPTTL